MLDILLVKRFSLFYLQTSCVYINEQMRADFPHQSNFLSFSSSIQLPLLFLYDKRIVKGKVTDRAQCKINAIAAPGRSSQSDAAVSKAIKHEREPIGLKGNVLAISVC